MILADVRDYLARHRFATLAELTDYFSSSPEAMRDMLGVLERKGRVQKTSAGGPGCGDCKLCATGSLELYLWIEKK
ncbi:MAG: FeoC-like transcriptional regulator [Halothiobacillaceae bacterium]